MGLCLQRAQHCTQFRARTGTRTCKHAIPSHGMRAVFSGLCAINEPHLRMFALRASGCAETMLRILFGMRYVFVTAVALALHTSSSLGL